MMRFFTDWVNWLVIVLMFLLIIGQIYLRAEVVDTKRCFNWSQGEKREYITINWIKDNNYYYVIPKGYEVISIDKINDKEYCNVMKNLMYINNKNLKRRYNNE